MIKTSPRVLIVGDSQQLVLVDSHLGDPVLIPIKSLLQIELSDFLTLEVLVPHKFL